MIDSAFSMTEIFDYEMFSDESIDLSLEQMDRAFHISQSAASPVQQWQTYLNALMLVAVEQWLDEWAPDLTVNDSETSLFQSTSSSFVNAVCNLQVGHHRVCLIATRDRYSPTVELPRVVIDSSLNPVQFYVLVEVLEEQQQAQIHGYLRQDQLVTHQQSTSLQPLYDWAYAIPSNWFNPDPTLWLLDLRCLDPGMILRQEAGGRKQEVGDRSQEAGDRGRGVGHTPQPLNVALWLRDRLDSVAQELSWMLMPALTPAMAELRSEDGFAAIQAALADSGMPIPPSARGAYQERPLDSVTLRLYAVVWSLPITDGQPEWTLLLVLGTVSDEFLPLGTGLQVQTGSEILVDQVVETMADPSLYARVIGTLDEQFEVGIRLPDRTTLTLPPFVFNLE